MSSIPGSGRPPGGGRGSPLQYSCLENPTDRGAWQAVVHGVAELAVTEATYLAQHTAEHRACKGITGFLQIDPVLQRFSDT